MKVVLFCGGYGMRMRDEGHDAPKPMAMIGDRPLLWHVMRYYAHFGHTEFILCLGYGAWAVKDYFLHYDETRSNDFVLRNGGATVDLLSHDIADWTITFVQTGLETPIGERLRRVRPHLGDDEMFLANYADVLTDVSLDDMVQRLTDSDAVASMLATPPQSSFHVVRSDDDQRVTDIHSVATLELRENGGYFVLRREVFDVLGEGEDLVGHALPRLAKERKVLAYEYDGFWMPADTLKERAQLEQMFVSGDRPWALWEGRTEPGVSRRAPRTAIAPSER
ncbi:MAG TPA: sugar phosphate nucleotidyltransferase [Jatrophihabitans sp.]|jgi:glucose-1-phosphate cytidylyltransferase|uniref:sugar phosphate nucleotidyltransferase n=1 Tax=Jatrophihabitans sp. TaxID=1932789 RepID=UPI002E00AA8B|nr:sugar phosphate nucleotidyltransferase [Jatrophihabitans sp.]